MPLIERIWRNTSTHLRVTSPIWAKLFLDINLWLCKEIYLVKAWAHQAPVRNRQIPIQILKKRAAPQLRISLPFQSKTKVLRACNNKLMDNNSHVLAMNSSSKLTWNALRILLRTNINWLELLNIYLIENINKIE